MTDNINSILKTLKFLKSINNSTLETDKLVKYFESINEWQFESTNELNLKIIEFTSYITNDLKMDEGNKHIVQKLFALFLFKKNNIQLPKSFNDITIENQNVKKEYTKELQKSLVNDIANIKINNDLIITSTPIKTLSPSSTINTASKGSLFNLSNNISSISSGQSFFKSIKIEDLDKFVFNTPLTIIILYTFETDPPIKGYKYCFVKSDSNINLPKKLRISSKLEKKNSILKTVISKSLDTIFGLFMEKKLNLIFKKEYIDQVKIVLMEKESYYYEACQQLFFIENYSKEEIRKSYCLTKITETDFSSNTSSLNTSILVENIN